MMRCSSPPHGKGQLGQVEVQHCLVLGPRDLLRLKGQQGHILVQLCLVLVQQDVDLHQAAVHHVLHVCADTGKWVRAAQPQGVHDLRDAGCQEFR